MDPAGKTPTLVASTGATYCCTIAESRLRERQLQVATSGESQPLLQRAENDNDLEVNYFKSAQW
jgi:telomerase Cajal body protein 1